MVHIGDPEQSFIMQSVKVNRPKPPAVTQGLLLHLYVEWICRPTELHFLDVQSNLASISGMIFLKKIWSEFPDTAATLDPAGADA